MQTGGIRWAGEIDCGAGHFESLLPKKLLRDVLDYRRVRMAGTGNVKSLIPAI